MATIKPLSLDPSVPRRSNKHAKLSDKKVFRAPSDEKEGVLWIKLPTESRSGTWKVWSKKFVSFKADLVLGVDSVTPSVAIAIAKTEKATSFTEDFMFKKWFTPDNSVVFRSKSRTQAYSFTICVDSEPVIHLAASSETETQSWITCFRSILWPPNSFNSLEKTVGYLFDVSIIDNEYSYRCGLLGAFGNLRITTEKVVLSDPTTGSTIQEWNLSSVGFKLLPQPHPKDVNKIVTMITDSNSSTGYGTIIMFCNEGELLIKRVHEVRVMFSRNYSEQLKQDIPGDDTLNESFSQRIKISPKEEESNPEEGNEHRRTLNRSISDPWLRKIIEGPSSSSSSGVSSARSSSGISSSPPLSTNSLPTTPIESPPFVISDRPSSLGTVPIKQSATKHTKGSSSPSSSGVISVSRRFFSWRNTANIPESMLDSSMNSQSLSLFKTNCKTICESPIESQGSEIRGSGSMKADDGDQEEGEKINNGLDGEQDDCSNDHRALHEAIAEETDSEGHDQTDDDDGRGSDIINNNNSQVSERKAHPPKPPRNCH